jgi:hypothetical protein
VRNEITREYTTQYVEDFNKGYRNFASRTFATGEIPEDLLAKVVIPFKKRDGMQY